MLAFRACRHRCCRRPREEDVVLAEREREREKNGEKERKRNKESMTLLVAGTSPRQVETAPSCLGHSTNRNENERKGRELVWYIELDI